MSINFADVKISSPEGTFRGLSVSLNGMDISNHVNRIEIDMRADEPLVFVKFTLLASVELDGNLLIETQDYKRNDMSDLEIASEEYDAAINKFMDLTDEIDKGS